MFNLIGGSYYTQEGDFLCGLKQLNPAGGWYKYDPENGWQIETPEVDTHIEIYLQDDLTYIGDKVIELEKYIKHYGVDVIKITFYTWHKKLSNVYPNLNIKWFPLFLKKHLEDAIMHRKEIENTFNFAEKTSKFLCLNARARRHRDIVVNKISKNPNCIFSYTHRGIKSPLENDWKIEDYRDYNTKGENYLTNTKNLLVASTLYNNTSFSLVTETRNDLPFDFFTEKTTQCFLALHPALYVSNKNHVAMLRDWGFDVFDDIFDHTYDSVENDQRIEKLFSDNKDLLTNGLLINESMKSRLLKNRSHYLENFSKNLPTYNKKVA
jgi:hypothetical protein